MKTNVIIITISHFIYYSFCFSQSGVNQISSQKIFVNNNLDSLYEVDYQKNYIKLINENEFIQIDRFHSNFRNNSKLELSTNTFKLPFIMTFGLQNNSYFDPKLIVNYNIKLDFEALKRQKIEKLNSIHSIEALSFERDPEVIKKTIWDNLKKDASLGLDSINADSYFSKIKILDSFENKISNKVEISKIQSYETLLSEYHQGNKIPNVNYDSIQMDYQKFQNLKAQYNTITQDKKLMKCRAKINELFQEKEKLSKINDLSSFEENKQLSNKSIFRSLNFKSLDFRKFNLGQSSLDLSDLAVKNHMINGVNIELKSPFIVHFAYSMPFQNNQILNTFVNSMQSTSVSTIGGAIGNEETKKYHLKIGFFNFKEKVINKENNSQNELKNNVLFINFKSQISKSILFQSEIAKSSSIFYAEGVNTPTLFDFNQFLNVIAFRGKVQSSFFEDNTKINVAFNHIANRFYSAANPFLVKGTEYKLDLSQKINSKWSFKSKNTYRSKDRDSFQIKFLSTSNELKFKWTKNTSFLLRNIYYQNEIYGSGSPQFSFSNQFSLVISHRMKIKKYYHLFGLTSQYIYGVNKISDSIEINNGNLATILATHNASIKNITINNSIEFLQKLDTAHSYLNISSNIDFNISKFRLGFGGNFRTLNDAIIGFGNTVFFESQSKFLNIHFNFGYTNYIQDKFTAINSQLRFSYLFH